MSSNVRESKQKKEITNLIY